MYKYIRIDNEIITENIISDLKLEEDGIIPVKNFCTIGENPEWYDEYFTRIEDRLLVENKIRTDNRGIYYDKNDGTKKEITVLDVDIPEEYTIKIPLENDIWNGTEWVIDIELQKSEKDKKILDELSTIDRESIRSIRAILSADKPDQKDIDILKGLEDEAKIKRDKLK